MEPAGARLLGSKSTSPAECSADPREELPAATADFMPTALGPHRALYCSSIAGPPAIAVHTSTNRLFSSRIKRHSVLGVACLPTHRLSFPAHMLLSLHCIPSSVATAVREAFDSV